MMIQQIDEKVGRAVTMGEGYEGEEVTAGVLLEARDIAISAAETAEGYAFQLRAIADELSVNLVADEADLRAKITVIGPSDATLVIATSIPLAEDLTIPSNIALAFKKHGQPGTGGHKDPHRQRPCRCCPLADIRRGRHGHRCACSPLRLPRMVRSCRRRYHG